MAYHGTYGLRVGITNQTMTLCIYEVVLQTGRDGMEATNKRTFNQKNTIYIDLQ
jgi:hypothetical protein